MENKGVDYQVIAIGKMVYDEIPNCQYEYEAIRKVQAKIGLKEGTVAKYYLCYLCYKKGIEDTEPKITTKGFDSYRDEDMERFNGEVFFDISDVMSEEELINSIKECINNEK